MKTPAQIERRLDGIERETSTERFVRPLRDILVDVGNELVESNGQTLTRFELMMRRHGKKVRSSRAINHRRLAHIKN